MNDNVGGFIGGSYICFVIEDGELFFERVDI